MKIIYFIKNIFLLDVLRGLKLTLSNMFSRKITVNQISPGYLENSIDLPPNHKLPTGRPVSFLEVFSAVRYFLSPNASQVTGNNLIISGGWNL